MIRDRAVTDRYHDLPILTFDFAHFRATAPARGYWRLLVEEKRFREIVGA